MSLKPPRERERGVRELDEYERESEMEFIRKERYERPPLISRVNQKVSGLDVGY